MNSTDSTREQESLRTNELAAMQGTAPLFGLDARPIDSTTGFGPMGVERSFDPDVVVAYAHGRRREIEDLNGIVVLRGAVNLLTRLPHPVGPSRPPAGIDWPKSAPCRRATNSSMDGYLNRRGSWQTRS